MQRGERTTLGELKVNDRFYFCSDAKKMSWQVITKKDAQEHWLHGTPAGKAEIEVRNDRSEKRFCKSTTEVVFLRAA